MPPAIAAAAIGAGAAIGGGIAGNEAGRGDRGQARNDMIDANAMIQKLKDAPITARPLILEQYRQAGILTPELEQQITSGPSKVEGITEDAGLRNAQMDALRSLTQRSKEGLTASDRASLNKVRQETQTGLEAKRAQILQNAQARGQAGGGSELAAALLAAQGGANQQSEESDRIMAMAQQNALQAASQMGQLGGQIRNQDFGVNEARASAADQMNRFNTQNQIQNQQRNVASKNNSQQYNLGNLQNINDRNVGQGNEELRRQRQGELTDWQNANDLANIKANSLRGQSNYLQKAGDRSAQNTSDMISGIGNMGAGIVGMFGSPSSSSSSSNPSSGYVSPGTAAGYGIHTTKSNPNAQEGRYDQLYDGGKVQNYKNGGQVSGHAQVSGDSPRNDTVKAMLSPGEIVVPRSLAESKLGKELTKLISAHNSVKHKLNGQD